MTVRCSINLLNVQTLIDVLKTSAGADLVGATKIFEREIGEEEIVCRIQSLVIISAHHCVRSPEGCKLLTARELIHKSEWKVKSLQGGIYWFYNSSRSGNKISF
jgi:hypothetical protein